VGRRLARLARSLIYRQDVTANGPVPVFAVRTNGKISIAFRGIDGRLMVHSATSPVAFEVCGIDQSSCRFADAKIEGDTVILSVADAADVRRVRYCWGDAPVCNLYDAAGLPAGPFELEVS
jgi:sialate O-acetylesterase